MPRSTMASLISRVRLLINDVLVPGGGQIWSDDQIQDVMDASRLDVKNGPTTPKPTFTGSTIQFLDYYTELGDWEDDLVLKQYLVNTVTPTTSENIVGHWTFSSTTLPPLYITGKTYDIYRSAADLLERQSVQWALSYNISMDGQSLQRGQVVTALQNLAKTYRMKQRARNISLIRTDTSKASRLPGSGLGPQEIDYLGSGDGR